MTEERFEGMLMTIIDTHREVMRSRKLWARIWAILVINLAALTLAWAPG